MTSHKTGTRDQWLAARNELLAKEKELTRRGDQLAAERRDLPWLPIEKQYRLAESGIASGLLCRSSQHARWRSSFQA